MNLSRDPLYELARAKYAIIQQKVEILEALTGCETNNTYYVYVMSVSGEFTCLFKCKEQSDCCERYWCR